MDAWIQHANFETEDRAAASVQEANAIFQSHDWVTALERRASLQEAGKEWCSPGFGLVADDGRILHLCPDGTAAIQCHYHYVMPRRLLGFIPVSRDEVVTWDDSRSSVARLIQLFFDGRHGDLLDQSRAAG